MAQTVVLGVGGGIAAYKAAALCSLLTKRGYSVEVLMTANATRFIQPLTFQSLSKHPVIVDTMNEPAPQEIAHIAIADRADLFVVAPATANLIGKLANGIADDMVSTTALAVTAPMLIAPAMNVHMLAHPAVQMNLEVLRARGAVIVDPGSGPLACGYTGKGRLAEPEDIADVIAALLARKVDLQGRSVVVTAGPTVEDIDPVRFLSNRSSGKMGYALAEAALLRGATVTLIHGPTSLAPVVGVKMVPVRSTEDMLGAVQAAVSAADVLISAAAPADFRPRERLEHKWKKSGGTPTLELEPTPDVLGTVAANKTANQVFVGFAAETRQALEYGRDKLVRKNLDLVVVNNVLESDAGFGVDTNRVTLVGRDEADEMLPLLPKHEVANRILDKVVDFFNQANEQP
ncbi:bifunctional phosphopantothenoylcysteine decarboxylase/phosphopantothenate--cysteine ligase CoaBC [Alicyclobacillus sp. ALC3]|uniref:bifunctional phosphopantothenoylcysteine decarboxylase/phosphopantothenate--cysteine ligase CoaBC n=1 Tax=Alicyclobacillus sp. ALC3 TaxID=2796143 RepID=UPI002379D83B|nr:bifunctional phosphopantothenoylcysteine decarboxylase/phosphopantothenate--cysteine ligase CoaBC [Alicyclobacillus sp. ALC3]WDL97417.1 bifunctional phosphopantothenoylcysteine decarboxylase/phosphopantothenate--cysteine ligase CoaBC [Alicyclobacillus sp. ALC3]